MNGDARMMLDLFVEYAPKLRAAGIAGRVEIPGGAFCVGGADPEPESTPEELAAEREKLERAMQQAEGPAQHDPATFGLGPDDEVPGYKRRPERRS